MAKTKKSKQWGCVLLDNYNDEYYEGVEEQLEKARQEQTEDEDEEEDYEDVYDYINQASEIQYSDLKDYKFPDNFLVCGYYSSRYGFGSGAGGKAILNADIYTVLSKTGKDCDYMKLGWERKNGNLKFIGTHHDGTVTYEIRELTDKGAELYKDWEYGDRLGNLDVQQIHEKMWKSPVYTKRITMDILK